MIMDRCTYGAETERSKGFKTRRSNPTALSLRETYICPGGYREFLDSTKFDRKAWFRASHESIRPFSHWYFKTPQGQAALSALDTWAQVTLVREASGDPSALPPCTVGGAFGGGRSLAAVALVALGVNEWLDARGLLLQALARFIFVSGWKPWRTKIAYYLHETSVDGEIKKLRDSIGRIQGTLESLRPSASSIEGWRAQVKKGDSLISKKEEQIDLLMQSMIVVLQADDPAPARSSAWSTIIVRRWTFDLATLDIEGVKPMGHTPHDRRVSGEKLVVGLVRALGRAFYPEERSCSWFVSGRDLGDEQGC